MTFLLPLLAFAMVLGFTLIVAGWCENRRDRELEVIDLHRDNIRRALDASRTFTGRAWISADISAPRYGASLHGADRGDPRSFLGGEGHRNLSDARLPLRVVDGRQTPRGSTRATSAVSRGSLPADPRNTNARAHGTGAR